MSLGVPLALQTEIFIKGDGFQKQQKENRKNLKSSIRTT